MIWSDPSSGAVVSSSSSSSSSSTHSTSEECQIEGLSCTIHLSIHHPNDGYLECSKVTFNTINASLSLRPPNLVVQVTLNADEECNAEDLIWPKLFGRCQILHAHITPAWMAGSHWLRQMLQPAANWTLMVAWVKNEWHQFEEDFIMCYNNKIGLCAQIIRTDDVLVKRFLVQSNKNG
jgi:hypothetical protein